MVDKKTEIVTNLGVIIVVISAIIAGTYQITTMKTQFELQLKSTNEKLVNEISERKTADDDIMQRLKENEVSMAEIKAGQGDIKVSIARIEENIIWLVDYVKKDKE